MRMPKRIRIMIVIGLLGLALPAGWSALSMANAEEATPTSQTSTTTESTTFLDVSEEMKQAIRAQDTADAERHIADYQTLLTELNVHETFRQTIQQLVIEQNHPIADVLIAYDYLYHQFGTSADLASLLDQKAQGMSWTVLFQQYDDAQTAFVPRAFEPAQLERLMKADGIGSDDIMIADRMSLASETSFDDLIHARMEGASWKQLNAQADVLYSADQLPRVQVTADQLDRFTGQGLTRQQVVEAFVLARKTDREPKAVIAALRDGATPAAVFAESYQAQYQ